MLPRLVLDLRYGFRVLRRNPAFTVVAILVLSLGIGVNTAFLGLLDALLFRPLPVRAPDQLVRITGTGTDGGVSYADALDYDASARALTGLATFSPTTLECRAEGATQTERVTAHLVSDNYFEVLGVDLPLGRRLGVNAPGAPPGVVLSDTFWRTRFAADSGVLGRSLWLNGASFAVLGVAPPSFTGTLRGGAPHLYVPYTSQVPAEQLRVRTRRELIAIGRLAPEASVETAQSELSVVARRLAETHPRTNRGASVTVGPERTAIFRDAPPLAYAVVAVYGVFGLLLVLACVNLSALLMARASFRRREIAVRAALGARPRVIAAQLLTESLILGLLGGVGGLFLGASARRLLWNQMQSAVAEHLGHEVLWIDTRIDVRLGLFTLGLALGSTVLFGLLPALHASRLDLHAGANADSTSPPRQHLSRLRVLVAGQVLLSTVLLSCAGLLVQTVRNAVSADRGFPIDRVYVADLDLSRADKTSVHPTFAHVVSHVRALPGVEAAALGGGGWPAYLPQSASPGRPRQNYVFSVAGPGLFEAMRIPMLSGREFDARDARGAAPVVILNQRLAEALWPGQDPLGRRLPLWDDQPAATVVGVTRTVRTFPLGPPFFMLYVPPAQSDLASLTLAVRTAPGQEETLHERLPGELRALHPDLFSVRVRALADWVGSLLAIPRALVTALAALGALGLALAAVGLQGVTAYVASRRARECAIRGALGASRLSIFRLLVTGALRTVAVGLGLGLALSLAVGGLLKSVLLGAAFDPLALVVAPFALAATAFLAVALPVLRASSIDPIVVLREE